jgi:BsuBI/PstI restriction endonuclease domain/BsuBI/PstI restriction endonuclease HTH domain
MHQFCDAGIAIYNPDKLDRPVNSPKAVYQIELAKLFAGAKAGLVYVTAFPNRAIMGRYLGEIAWETEVWVANSPSHLIHFNGERFLGPYGSPK